jgi:hypothetical protein
MTVALRWALLDSWNIARRDLLRWVANPTRILAELGFSASFVLLFGYVFGSGMSVPGGGDYIEFLMPGLFAQFTAFGIGATMQEVAVDADKGITDRFRSLPISGVAVVGGRCLADMVNSLLGLAITVGMGVVVGWTWHGTTGEALAAVGLSEHAERPVDELSAGQRGRVALARAVAARPLLLLADEPTARLDATTTVAVGSLLRDLAHRSGTTLVCATHDPLLIEQADEELRLG